MNLGLSKDEALLIKDLLINCVKNADIEVLKILYPNTDIENLLRQLEIIIMLAD